MKNLIFAFCLLLLPFCAFGQISQLPALQDSSYYLTLSERIFIQENQQTASYLEYNILSLKHLLSIKQRSQLNPKTQLELNLLMEITDSLLKEEQQLPPISSCKYDADRERAAAPLLESKLKQKMQQFTDFEPSLIKNIIYRCYHWEHLAAHKSFLSSTSDTTFDVKAYWKMLRGGRKGANDYEGNGLSFRVMNFWQTMIDELEAILKKEKGIFAPHLTEFRPQIDLKEKNTFLQSYFGQMHPIDVLSTMEKQLIAAVEATIHAIEK